MKILLTFLSGIVTSAELQQSELQKISILREKNNGDLVGRLDFEYKSYFEEIKDSNSLYPYRPMLWGKFEFEDGLNPNGWTDETSLRVCMEIGTVKNSENYMEQVRWYRKADENSEWKVQSMEGLDMLKTISRGQFCTNTIDDSSFENEGKSLIVPS